MENNLVVEAVRELLKVNNGGSRSNVAVVYDKLTDDQLKLLWKDIYRATRELAPGDIMFSSGVRQAGINLMAKHHAREGLDTAVWYLTNQKPHGAKNATVAMLDIILKQYGGHAKVVIPQLEKAADYLATEYKSDDMAKDVRTTIKAIESAPTPPWKMISIAEYLK